MIKRIAMLAVCAITVLSIGGVSATWFYAQSSPTPVEQLAGVSISEFDYKPEEILPGGGEGTGEVQLGENHFAVIKLIVDEADKGYNLNNSGSILHSILRNERVAYSNQKISGGNLKFILDAKNNTHKLYYCVEKAGDTLYYVYTFSTDSLSTVGGTDLEIEVYKTSIEKTDRWRATVSHLGYAKTVRLSSLGLSADPQSIVYTIDVDSWHL